MTFRAKYPGRCAQCEEVIEQGDLLDWTDDAQVVHDGCIESVERNAFRLKPRETCPRCFTEKAVTGACLCDDGAA
jgi:hypothetical protein